MALEWNTYTSPLVAQPAAPAAGVGSNV